jgi:hypothetical protein
MFLVPKPVDKWRLTIDLRELNNYCAKFNDMSCEALKHLRHLSRPGDYLDLADGYYTLGIR